MESKHFRDAMADLNSLLIFARVVEANSFSEASRRLKMPTSTVSRRIAELEDQLGVRLLERSTRSLRLTDVGAEVLEHAQRSAELVEVVDHIVSQHSSQVSGTLRLAAPPSISDSLLVPLASAFQAAYPEVRIQVFISERYVDPISDGIDLAFRVGDMKDSSLVVRKLLGYRHQLVASPAYLEKCKAPKTPQDLRMHRLLAFTRPTAQSRWSFVHVTSREKQALTFQPHLAMNDYAGLSAALLAGAGIADLPPIVRPEWLRQGKLVEVMPKWRLGSVDFSMVYAGSRHLSRLLRVFKEFAVQEVPKLFPGLPL